MKNLNISTDVFTSLLNLCKANRKEQNGKLKTKIDNDELYSYEIELSEETEVAKRTNSSVVFDTRGLIERDILSLFNFDTSKEAIVYFHTHPGKFSTTNLSGADISCLKYENDIISKACEKLKKDDPIVLSVVATGKNIAAYTVDNITKEVVCVPVFVENVELIPDSAATGGIFSSFKAGFDSARKK